MAWGEMGSAPCVAAQTLDCDLSLSRHDHHNLEIQTRLPPQGEAGGAEVDVFVFIPPSLRGTRWSKSDLAQDFRSRARLALPADNSEGAASRGTLRDTLEKVTRLLDRPEMQDADFKHAGALVADLLKQRARNHRRRFLMAHALNIPPVQRPRELERLTLQVRETAEFLGALRALIARLGPQHPVLDLLDEYVSNFQVQYLDELSRAATEPAATNRLVFEVPGYAAARLEWDKLIAELTRLEAGYRLRFPGAVERATDAHSREQSVVRLGQLKKYFQSRMFLQVCRHRPSNRFVEMTAVAATALAGLVWALVQGVGTGSSLASANPGAWMVTLVVIAYVLRDRLKDRAKVSLHRQVQSWLPDQTQQLHVDGREIGSIQEWFHLADRESLPEPVRNRRLAAASSSLERDLGEDVLFLKKRIRLQANAATGKGWALQENTRINLERYLKFMDDPFKELALLDEGGGLLYKESRRVYHFHVLVEVRALGRPWVSPYRQMARVVLDKSGIDRLEPIHQS